MTVVLDERDSWCVSLMLYCRIVDIDVKGHHRVCYSYIFVDVSCRVEQSQWPCLCNGEGQDSRLSDMKSHPYKRVHESLLYDGA
jgi:hypothetical protein